MHTLSACAHSFNTLLAFAASLSFLACSLKMLINWLMELVVMLGGGMIPVMALVKLSAARMRALDGVSVG